MIKPNETRGVNPDETREVNPDEVVAMGAANDANDNYWNNKKHAEIELKQIYGTRGCDAILSQSNRKVLGQSTSKNIGRNSIKLGKRMVERATHQTLLNRWLLLTMSHPPKQKRQRTGDVQYLQQEISRRGR